MALNGSKKRTKKYIRVLLLLRIKKIIGSESPALQKMAQSCRVTLKKEIQIYFFLTLFRLPFF